MVVERLRTGRPTKTELDDEIYALYTAGAPPAAQPQSRTVQVRYLATDQVEPVVLKPRSVDSRLAKYDAAIVGILNEDYPPEPNDRVCPRCPNYFICPAIADADAQLRRIALENLLGNAWKFFSKKENARIEFGVQQRGVKRVYFVRDNGAGFAMAGAEKLFGAFQRLHSSADFPGTGIGLTTVQRIIRRHGGRVRVDSAVGRGTTFYFTLNKGETER